MTIRTHRNETIAASEYIHANLQSSYLGSKGSNNYYNVNGVVWEIWQFGMGNYPTSNGVSVKFFTL
jgi:hypothetical protein